MMDTCIVLFYIFMFGVVLVESQISVKLGNHTYGPYDDKEGEFGYSYMGTFHGSLYLSNPANACGPIKPLEGLVSKSPNMFVLIDDGGGCSYYEKIANAKKAAFSAAIVRNMDSDDLVTMKGPRIDMLGLYVSKTTGIMLAKFNYTTSAIISIHVDFTLNLEIYLVPLVVIIGICFTLMLLFLVVKYWRTRIHERRSRLTPANLKKIPTKKFREGDEYDLCAICLDDYKSGEKLRILPCNHAYHCKCVDPWLTNGKKTCPVCKQQVEKGEPSSSDDAASSGDVTDATETTPLLTGNLPSISHQSVEDASVAALV